MGSRISFRIAQHELKPGTEIVEVCLDGHMVATIYPDEKDQQGVKLVSAHFAGELTTDDRLPEGVKMESGEKSFPPVPGLRLSFAPRPYGFKGGKLTRNP